MDEPHIEVLNVCRIPVSEELVEEQADLLYGEDLPQDERAEALSQSRGQLESVVLVEALVAHADDRFDMGDFTQDVTDLPRENWQAAWAEAYLSEDGSDLLSRWNKRKALPVVFRVALFMHNWQPDVPLTTSYGDVACPQPGPMPDRLLRLVLYEAVD